MGWALYQLGRFQEARTHMDMAVFLNPKFCLAYNNMGRLDAHMGSTKKAMNNFTKAIKLCPRYAEPHYFLGRIYAALSSPGEAKRHFDRCYELEPEAPYGQRCREAL